MTRNLGYPEGGADGHVYQARVITETYAYIRLKSISRLDFFAFLRVRDLAHLLFPAFWIGNENWKPFRENRYFADVKSLGSSGGGP